MSDELARIGFALELATTRSVSRRRTRLQALRGAVLSFVLAVPFALAHSGALDPSAGPLPSVPRLVETALAPPTIAFMVRHIPDESSESQVTLPCLDARDCRVPIVPSLEPAPPGKV